MTKVPFTVYEFNQIRATALRLVDVKIKNIVMQYLHSSLEGIIAEDMAYAEKQFNIVKELMKNQPVNNFFERRAHPRGRDLRVENTEEVDAA
jgi:hypothetical protein